MSRLSSILLILLAFAILAKTGVTSFAPDLTKFTAASTTAPSDWSEESAEEDEAGEEDKAVNGMPVWESVLMVSAAPRTNLFCMLPDQSPEIVVPPPQV